MPFSGNCRFSRKIQKFPENNSRLHSEAFRGHVWLCATSPGLRTDSGCDKNTALDTFGGVNISGFQYTWGFQELAASFYVSFTQTVRKNTISHNTDHLDRNGKLNIKCSFTLPLHSLLWLLWTTSVFHEFTHKKNMLSMLLVLQPPLK